MTTLDTARLGAATPTMDDPGTQLLRLFGVTPATPVGVPLPRARYREFIDALGVAVYTTDADGRITFYNEAAAEFWGRKPDLGELWCGSWRLFWPDGKPMSHDACPMAVALRENRPVRGGEAVAERPDGSRVTFVPYPTPIRDEDGELVGAVNVLVDVTERHAAEERLRASAESLRASNAVKDEFLGLVSHELRTPVTTIFGNAQLLRDRGDRIDAAARSEMLADIADDAERLQSIVENMLALTRLGTGVEANLEPQLLDHVVRTAVQAFSRRHPGRPVEVGVGAGRVLVEADRTHLELVLENLLANADKYSPRGVPVELKVHADGDEAIVTVSDRGIGVTDAEVETLFEPFYRSGRAQAHASGMGIGLAVCRRLIEAQGGRIWAQPRDGGGSEFRFSLPVPADSDAVA